MSATSLELATNRELLQELMNRFDGAVFVGQKLLDDSRYDLGLYAHGNSFCCESLARHAADYISAGLIELLDEVNEDADE